MRLETSRFGVIELDESQIIRMKRGLIGFRDKREWVIIRPKPGSAMFWLQSVDSPELAFVMTSPYLFVPDYRISPGKDVLAALEAESESELEIYVLVTIPPGKPEEMTANLIGPVVINSRTRLAEQLVVEDSPYTHKHRLITKEQLERRNEG